MKKCASCTKDLPDAALHCVFCGAKQAPAPATSGGTAKTVMGAYSANDMMEHLKQQGVSQPASNTPAAAAHRPAAAPQGVGYGATIAAPHEVPKPGYAQPPQPAYGAPPHTVPSSQANAATMFVPGGNPPPGAFGGGHQVSHPVGTSPSHASSVPLSAPVPPPPLMPIPSAVPPYLASQTAARAGRPIEPWKDALRVLMFIWGGVLLVAFATPLSIDPLIFNWNLIANAEGTAKLPPLIMVAVGVLAIAIAAIPMSPTPRGMIAALIGLAGVFVPLLIHGVPPWQLLVPLAGIVVLIPNLLVRHEYRDALVARILVTVGVVAALVPYVVPQNGSMALVELFKLAIDAPGAFKVIILLQLALIVVLVLSLLAWLPSPSSGGAKVFAWLLILWPAITHAIVLVLSGDLVAHLKASPFASLMTWVGGGGGLAGADDGAMGMPGLGIGVAYAILIGYGLATVIGKKLE